MMKSLNHILLFIWTSCLLTSCNYCFKSELKEKMERKIAFREKLMKAEVDETDSTKKIIYERIIGYDSQYRVINDDNFQFFEYNEFGQLIKKYSINNQRIKGLFSKPIIYEYHYINGRLQNVTRKVELGFLNKQNTKEVETYKYDKMNRLIMKTNFSSDTITYSYKEKDTLPITQRKVEYINNSEFKLVSQIRITNYEYDTLGRKIRETWKYGDGLSMNIQYYYDAMNRIILKKDSSLNYERTPNSYILFWKHFKYDQHNRVIEELNTGGTVENPKPSFMSKTIYNYVKI